MPKSKELPTVTLRGVEIFAAGTWSDSEGRRETYSEKDLDAMVTAFNETKDKFSPYLKIGHKDKTRYQDSPAFGWMTGMRRAGKKLVADFAQVPGKLGQLIISGAFPNRSAEILKTPQIGGKVWPWAIKAVALLGANHPALDSLQAITDLYATPEGEVYGFTDQDGAEPHLTYEAILAAKEEPSPNNEPQGKEGNEMPDAKVKELEASLEAERAAKVASDKANEELKAEMSKQAEERWKRDIQIRVDAGKKALETAFTAGKLAPVTRPYLEQIVQIVAENEAVLSFSAEKDGKPEDLTGIQVFEKMLDAAPSGLKFGTEKAKPTAEERKLDGDPTTTLDARARDYMKEHSMEKTAENYSAAVAEVLASDPALKASSGRPANFA